MMVYSSNQEYVKSAPEFWVFCVDFHKHKQICPTAQLDYAEVLLIGAVDTGIMSQNVLLAAESLGLGGVYIGSLRNEMDAVGKLLNCRNIAYQWSACAWAILIKIRRVNHGYQKKPYSLKNAYQPLDTTKLDEYNQTVAEYYRQRSNIDMDWSRNVIKSLDKPIRPKVLAYLQQQGFIKK